MRIETTPIAGCVVLHPERHVDERGFFARTWDAAELAAAGVDARIAQCSVSFNHMRGTLRGMHFQRAPHAESKIVRCARGAIFDVCLDLRPGSPTYGRWHAERLTEDNGVALVVPEGCAHGFQTLADDTEVLYLISAGYAPDAAGGVRYDDPAFGIAWPEPVAVIHPRDAGYPLVGGAPGPRTGRR